MTKERIHDKRQDARPSQLGSDYEVYVLIKYAFKGFKLEGSNIDFNLKTQDKNAGNLDDVVYGVLNGGTLTKEEYIQVKHGVDDDSCYKPADIYSNNYKQHKTSLVYFFKSWYEIKILGGKDLAVCELYSNKGLTSLLSKAFENNLSRFNDDFIEENLDKYNKTTKKTRRDLFENIAKLNILKDVKEEDKKKLTMQFLKEFKIRVGKKYIDQLEEELRKTLHPYAKNSNVFFDYIYAYFKRWARAKEGVVINKSKMKSIIEKGQVLCSESQKLLGKSEGLRDFVLSRCKIRINRSHLVQSIDMKIANNKFTAIFAEKGYGKSVIAEQILRKKDKNTWFFIDSETMTVEIIDGIRRCIECGFNLSIVVFDGIDHMPQSNREVVNAFEALLDYMHNESDIPVLFTVTPYALPRLRDYLRGKPLHGVKIGRLDRNTVLEHYPKLKIYMKYDALINLACHPEYLRMIIGKFGEISELVQQLGRKRPRLFPQFYRGARNQSALATQGEHSHTPLENPHALLSRGQAPEISFVKQKNKALSQDHALKKYLIQLVLYGTNDKLSKDRKKLCYEITKQMVIAKQRQVRNDFVGADLKLIAILKQDLVLREVDGMLSYSHDIYFDYSVVDYLDKKYDSIRYKRKLPRFMRSIANVLQGFSGNAVFVEWLRIRFKGIIQYVPAINDFVKKNFKLMLTLSIISNENNYLMACLKAHNFAPNGKSNPWLKDDISFFDLEPQSMVELLIRCDKPAALEIALQKVLEYEKLRMISEEMTKLSTNGSESVETSEDSEQSTNDSEGDSSDSSGSDESSKLNYAPSYQGGSDDSSKEEIEYTDTDAYYDEIYDAAMGVINRFRGNPHKYMFSVPFYNFTDDLEDTFSFYQPREASPNYDTGFYFLALKLNRLECLKVLLKFNFSQEFFIMSNKHKETLLHVAVLKDTPKAIVKLLLKETTNCNQGDAWSETALHNAVYKNNHEHVKLLLEYGANPNAENKYGITPFHIALVKYDWELVELLLDYGADLTIRPFSIFSDSVIFDGENQVDNPCYKYFSEFCVADMLDDSSQVDQSRMEEIVIKIIQYLDCGFPEYGDTTWGSCSEISKDKDKFNELKKKQIAMVDDEKEGLLALVEHRVQINEFNPGFDFVDDETELEYTLNENPMHDLNEEYVFSDADNVIALVSSDYYEEFFKDNLDEYWFLNVEESEQPKVVKYGYDESDEAIIELFKKSCSDDGKALGRFYLYALSVENKKMSQAVLVLAMKDKDVRSRFDKFIKKNKGMFKPSQKPKSDSSQLKQLMPPMYVLPGSGTWQKPKTKKKTNSNDTDDEYSSDEIESHSNGR